MFINHNNAQFYTVSFGSSPRTLVAIGGWAGSWEVWTETFSVLSTSWRVIGYDHRGTGATIAPADSISLETMVGDMFAILDALKVERCVLGAESAGAAVAVLAALQQPERFSGLVLVDGLIYQPDTPSPFLMGLQSQYKETVAAFVDACVPEPDSAAIRRWGRQILGRASQESAIRLYEAMNGVDLRDQVRGITQPTLLIHGSADQIVDASSSVWLASQIPNAQLQIIEGAGHVPTVTRPHDVAQAITAYFA